MPRAIRPLRCGAVDNVILLGDSIRLGFQATVAAALPHKHVWGPERNCRSSRDLDAELDEVVPAHHDRSVTVHLNAGLHDLRRSEATNWQPLVPLDEYRANLESILARLVSDPHIGADGVIVATTTPVDGARHNVTRASRRHLEDVVAYNEVLVAVAERHSLRINDLFTVVTVASGDLLSADGVHFTAEGYRVLGEAVASAIGACDR